MGVSFTSLVRDFSIMFFANYERITFELHAHYSANLFTQNNFFQFLKL